MKRIITPLGLLYLLSLCPLSAQVLPRPVEVVAPQCLHTDKGQDSLIFPGRHKRFDVLYRRLTDLFQTGRGRVNILHIGGSHVQAGFFSHRVRTNFSRLGGSSVGNRGLLFPFAALKTNAPRSYRLSCSGVWTGQRCVSRDLSVSLGLSGASVLTRDTLGSLTLQLSDLRPWSPTSLRLLGDAEASGIFPMMICGGDTLYPQPFDGRPGWNFPISDAADSCVFLFRGVLQDSLGFRVRGILPEGRTDGITYTASGINGAAVPSWLRCSKFAEELSLVVPDLVIFGIGINDANVAPTRFSPAEFKDNYRQLMALFRAQNPDCCFIFITNNDCWLNVRGYRKRYNPNTAHVQQAMRELARESDGALFDVFSLMGGKGSSSVWVREKLLRSDHIHFTAAGYELMGDLLYNALIYDYLAY